MSLFDTFQARVGRDQGATRFFIASDGNLNVGDVQNGANGTDFTGAVLLRLLNQFVTRASFTLASAIQTTSVIPTEYGVVNFYYPSATTSVKLPEAKVGAVLLLKFDGVLSTVSILPGSTSLGSAQSVAVGASGISCILASATGASSPFVRLFCETAACWQIADTSGASVSPQRIS